MELYLQYFFFFSEFTISKNLISPLSTKKSTYRKRTHKKFVVLALLPKIDRIRLTKTPETKRRAREPAAPPRPAQARPSPRPPLALLPRQRQGWRRRPRLLSPSQHPLSNDDYVKQQGEGGEAGKKNERKLLTLNSYAMVRLSLGTQRMRTTRLRDYVKTLRKIGVWRGLKRGGGEPIKKIKRTRNGFYIHTFKSCCFYSTADS